MRTMRTFAGLHVGRTIDAGSVALFQVWTVAPGVCGVLTGAAARVAVGEVTSEPSVSELGRRATNSLQAALQALDHQTRAHVWAVLR